MVGLVINGRAKIMESGKMVSLVGTENI